MKRMLSLLLCAALLFAMSACGDNETVEEKPVHTASTTVHTDTEGVTDIELSDVERLGLQSSD